MVQQIITLDVETVLDEEAAAACRYRSAIEPAADSRTAPFAPIPLHRIVCVSLLRNRERGRQSIGEDFALTSFHLGRMHEADILRAVEDKLAEIKGDQVVMITYNGRSFDAPVLMARAMVHGLFDARHIARLAGTSRYDDSRHLDVADLLANFGAAPRATLVQACAPLKIPVKTGAAGVSVAALAAAGDFEAIARYCETDVIATWLLAQHARAIKLQRSPLSVAQGWVSLAEWIDKGGKKRAHLQPFADKPLIEAARDRVAAYWDGPETWYAEMDRIFETWPDGWVGHRPKKEVL